MTKNSMSKSDLLREFLIECKAFEGVFFTPRFASGHW